MCLYSENMNLSDHSRKKITPLMTYSDPFINWILSAVHIKMATQVEKISHQSEEKLVLNAF